MLKTVNSQMGFLKVHPPLQSPPHPMNSSWITMSYTSQLTVLYIHITYHGLIILSTNINPQYIVSAGPSVTDNTIHNQALHISNQAGHTHRDLVIVKAINSCLSLKAGVDSEDCGSSIDGKEGGGCWDPHPILSLQSLHARYGVTQLRVGSLRERNHYHTNNIWIFMVGKSNGLPEF